MRYFKTNIWIQLFSNQPVGKLAMSNLWSLWVDLKILVKTIPAVLKGAGAI